MTNIFFLLGSKDLEMDTVERLLKAALEKNLVAGYGYAATEAGRCNPGNVYQAARVLGHDGTEVDVPSEATLVEVECHLALDLPINRVVVDHHKPGDPGYGRPAAEAIQASSLGQVAMLLASQMAGMPRNQFVAVSAADHNLAAAYTGQVPGVSAEDVLAVRLPEIAARNRVGIEEARVGIEAAVELLAQAPEVMIGGNAVKDIREYGVQPFALEAATMSGIAFIGRVDTRNPDKVFLSAPAEVVTAFLDAPLRGITNTYGDPARGFAGGLYPDPDEYVEVKDLNATGWIGAGLAVPSGCNYYVQRGWLWVQRKDLDQVRHALSEWWDEVHPDE